MLVQLQRNWAVENPQPAPSSVGNVISFENLLGILRRRFVLIGACMALMLALGAAYLATTRAMYGSTATLYLDIQNAKMVQGDGSVASVAPLGLDEANVNSQTLIIESEKIALKAINELKLKDLPEFTRPQSLLSGYISTAKDAVRGLLRFGQTPPVAAEASVSREVIDTFNKRLKVERFDNTFVLAISFLSEDPVRAADVANAVASAYLEEKLDARYESVRRASSWLEARLAELGQQAVASDQLVQNYKRDYGIIDTNTGNGQLLSDTQLTDLSARLVEARKETSERKARFDQIQQMIVSGNPDASVVDSLQSSVINQLREQYSGASQQESDIARRYGPNHEAAQKLRNKMADINRLILTELGRIAQVYRSDLQVATSQETDLTKSLEEYTARSTDISQARVKLRELERDAQADQNLYQSFLDRYKSALQQESFPITDARVLTTASPAQDKSSPKSTITLALSGIAGLALGLMLALGRELADRTFRSPTQVERMLNVTCLGVLPKLGRSFARRPKRNRKRADDNSGAGQVLSADLGVYQHAVKAPLSRFSETLRAVKLAADFAAVDGGLRVIGVVSSVPGEGKSTIAMNIGELLAVAGNSVLVMDGDLRSPMLTRELTPNARAGLLDALAGAAQIEDLVYADPVKPLKFLPASGKAGLAHTSDLMGSVRMASLIGSLRQTYDYVVIDLPPLAPVVDAKAIAGTVDGFVYVIEWGRTSVATVKDALHNAPSVSQKIVGCLLNKADMRALRLYTKTDFNSEYYSYDKFGSYLTRD